MIQYLLLQNRQGKTRLSKYYRAYTDEERSKIESDVHRIVTTRDPKFTNFVEYTQYKLIYRRYAGLFFTLCVDVNDNELLYFESIHLFVELLDQFFGNVCELDLVFNFNKVCGVASRRRRNRPRLEPCAHCGGLPRHSHSASPLASCLLLAAPASRASFSRRARRHYILTGWHAVRRST